MFSFLPVQTEIGIFLAGAILLLSYALLVGNGRSARDSHGRLAARSR